MNEIADLEALVRSAVPIIAIETHEETRVVELFRDLAKRIPRPLFHWTVTEGLRRADIDAGVQRHNREPAQVLGSIKAHDTPGIYILADLHPWLEDATHVRLLKDIAIGAVDVPHTLVLVSHALDIPDEVRRYSARMDLSLPDAAELRRMVAIEARRWAREPAGSRVRSDRDTLDRLVESLAGLTLSDARRLVRQAIADDGAITLEDMPQVARERFRMLARHGILELVADRTDLDGIGGLERLKKWLTIRRDVFRGAAAMPGVQPPKGILLIGVQGCGKSLAAKAVAGAWHVPLLRLDFGSLHNKYHGETERNLRESLSAADSMAPCVLWMDEIEKGLYAGDSDGGTSRRVLGTLLTWMAERESRVFLVATANDVMSLPPELMRKGRFDEVFFVDLPDSDTRRRILAIHLQRRGIDSNNVDLGALVAATGGFSGSELEQLVVAALYAAHAEGSKPATGELLQEAARTRPLSVLRAEHVQTLREWARERTVPAD